VQPAVRRALGRDDIWGVGLTMSVESVDTVNGFWQFVDAYEADYVGTGSFLPEWWSETTRDGRLVIDDPEVRRRLTKALDYTERSWPGPSRTDWASSAPSRPAVHRP
jgi:hypothetical protein